MLVDSHCHLNYPEFIDDIPAVIAKAKQNGVEIMQTICIKISEMPQIYNIIDNHKTIYGSVGLHPNHVGEEDSSLEQILEHTKHSKIIGIGETGLDYYYGADLKDKQIASFKTHIKAAQQTQLPLIIHTRDADDDTIQILQESYNEQPFKILIHCFTAGQKLADAIVAMGGYISLSGILTFKNAKEIQEVARDFPLDRILVETDAPYLAPVPYRGKTNHPAYTRFTAEFLADLKGKTYDDIAQQTTKNFMTLFDKVSL